MTAEVIAVEVEDREDGLLSHGDISAESVGFSISMVEAGFDPAELDAVDEEDPVLARFPVAAGLIQKPTVAPATSHKDNWWARL